MRTASVARFKRSLWLRFEIYVLAIRVDYCEPRTQIDRVLAKIGFPSTGATSHFCVSEQKQGILWSGIFRICGRLNRTKAGRFVARNLSGADVLTQMWLCCFGVLHGCAAPHVALRVNFVKVVASMIWELCVAKLSVERVCSFPNKKREEGSCHYCCCCCCTVLRK